MTIIIRVDDPGDIIGIKEAIAMDLEKYGRVEVLEIKEEERQESLWKT